MKPLATVLVLAGLMAVGCDSGGGTDKSGVPTIVSGGTQAPPSQSVGGTPSSGSHIDSQTFGGDAIIDSSGVNQSTVTVADDPTTPLVTQHALPDLKNPRIFTVMSAKNLAIQPSVAFGTDGGLGIAWCGMTDDNLGVFFTVYGRDEEPLIPPIVANTTEMGIQNEPTVCSLSGGGYVVAWSQDSQGDVPNLGMRYRRFDPRGQAMDEVDQFVQTDQPSNHWLTHLACDNRGGFAITGVFGEPNSTFGVFVQRYGLDGRADGESIVLNPDPAGTQSYPAVVIDADGHIIVGWEDNADDGTPSRVVLRRILSTQDTPEHAVIPVGPQDVDVKSPALLSVNKKGDILLAVTIEQRRIGLYRVDRMGQVHDVNSPSGPLAYLGVLTKGSDDEAMLMHLAGRGADMVVKLLRVDVANGSGDSVTLPTQRVAPYQPSIANYGGRLAAAWTERTEDMGFQVRLAIFGARAVESGE